jgi:serine/threonine protein kinase
VIELVRRSQLVDPQRLALYREQASDVRGEPAVRAFLARLVKDELLTAFQASVLLQGKWLGFFLGAYKLLEPLGKGSISRVYLAEHVGLGRRVAVKVLSAGKSSEQVVARFHREAQALAALRHPNIVRVYDIDRAGDSLFMVMEYLVGLDLQRFVSSKGPLDVARAVHVICQAALGLEHAHRMGWVHRDVKPANLMLDDNDTVKLLDLGLARLCEDESNDLTAFYGGILGTADYRAPEQSVDSHEVDGRADIYSLGATFYFLLTGQPPFDGRCPGQNRAPQQAAGPQSLRLLRPDVPAGLEAVVDRMMARNPEQRYQTAAEVVVALDSWAAGPGPLAVEGSKRRVKSQVAASASTPIPFRPAVPGAAPWHRGLWLGLLGVLSLPLRLVRRARHGAGATGRSSKVSLPTKGASSHDRRREVAP